MKLFITTTIILNFILFNKISARQNFYHTHENIDWPHLESVRITESTTKYGYDNYSNNSDYDFQINSWKYFTQSALRERLDYQYNTNQAKNVIIFVGEDIPHYTMRMAKLYMQCIGDPCYDSLPHHTLKDYFKNIARVKNSCYQDYEPDKACSATSILTGVQSNIGTIALNHNVKFNQQNFSVRDKLSSIAKWAQIAGKRTGLVTTGLVTSPTVSPYYGHISNYNWQSDYDMFIDNAYFRGFDLASQLIHGRTGSKLNLIFGGGRKKFLPFQKYGGERLDKRNLINEWIKSKRGQGESVYRDTREGLPELCRHTDYILGLFDMDKLDHDNNPTLAELATAAVNILDKKKVDDEGYVLFVQSTNTNSKDKYSDVVRNTRHHLDFRAAIKAVIDLTDQTDTLIVVLNDHYNRPLPVKLGGEVEHHDRKDKSYSTDWAYHTFGTRVTGLLKVYEKQRDLWESNQCDIRDTGDDSVVLAMGPFSHLFRGTLEQNFIAHFIGYAACIGNGVQMCD